MKIRHKKANPDNPRKSKFEVEYVIDGSKDVQTAEVSAVDALNAELFVKYYYSRGRDSLEILGVREVDQQSGSALRTSKKAASPKVRQALMHLYEAQNVMLDLLEDSNGVNTQGTNMNAHKEMGKVVSRVEDLISEFKTIGRWL